jgi:O-antigen/teichoic acid export membrane protein
MKVLTFGKSIISRDKTAGLVFSNTFFQLFGKVVSMSITMLTTILIARSYGVEGYGYFNLMQSIPALFFIIVDFGFNAVALRELEKRPESAQKYFFNILVMRVLFSALIIILTSLAVYAFFPYPADLKFGIYLSLFLVLTHALYASGNLIFQFKLRYDYSTLGYISGAFLVLILSLCLIYFRANIIWVNFTYFLGGVTTFFVSLRYLSKLGIRLGNKDLIDFSLWKSLFMASLPLGLTFLFSQVNFRADTLLLSKLSLPQEFGFNNVETVAVYGLAYKVFEVCLVLPTFFMNAVYPIYVKKLNIGATEFKYFFLKTLGALSLLSAFLTIFGYIFAPLMIKILGGEQFIDSVFSLRVLFGGISVFFISAPISYFILTLGKQKYLPFAYALAGFVNVIGNILLIPRYSYIASSYLTWISELVILVLLSLFAVRAWRLYNSTHEKLL